MRTFIFSTFASDIPCATAKRLVFINICANADLNLQHLTSGGHTDARNRVNSGSLNINE